MLGETGNVKIRPFHNSLSIQKACGHCKEKPPWEAWNVPARPSARRSEKIPLFLLRAAFLDGREEKGTATKVPTLAANRC